MKFCGNNSIKFHIRHSEDGLKQLRLQNDQTIVPKHVNAAFAKNPVRYQLAPVPITALVLRTAIKKGDGPSLWVALVLSGSLMLFI